MTTLLDQIRQRKLPVLYFARLTGIPNRTMQDCFDKQFNGKEDLENLVKFIIRRHDELVRECKNAKI